MKKLLSLAIILVCIVGCQNTATYADKTTRTKKYHLPPFKSIIVQGNSLVRLANGPRAITITGLQQNMDDYQFEVKNQTLHVMASYFANKARIKITAPNVKSLTVLDNTILKAKNFKTGCLTLTAKDNASINLEGRYHIDSIYQYGGGKINVRWVDSDKLFVISDAEGPINLAGTANKLVAKLSNNASLDARYLNTKMAWVSAEDGARADLLVIDKLKAIATGESNIIYYKRPKVLRVTTRGSGNVLYHSPFLKSMKTNQAD